MEATVSLPIARKTGVKPVGFFMQLGQRLSRLLHEEVVSSSVMIFILDVVLRD